MKWIEGGVTAPKGFRASGVSAGIKRSSKRKKDCALVISETPAVVAGMFTKNVMKAPPVYWDLEVCKRGQARAVFINSGNANAATGAPGHRDVAMTAKHVADRLGIEANEVCICSTGVIGVPLPMDRIREGVEMCVEELSVEGSLDAATAIMTTDTVAKEKAVEVGLSEGRVRIGIIAKGSGMLHPDMATMIAIITTDANVHANALKELVQRAVDQSFHRISVDNDMSTSDTVLVFANGACGLPPLQPGSTDWEEYEQAFSALCVEMAKMLVKDGEGATKFVEIAVWGAKTDSDADRIARAIANSQLCKTAFFGQDPNWGRFACAAGYSGVEFNPDDLCIWLDDVQIVAGGLAADYKEEDAAARMRQDSFRIGVSIGDGPGQAVFWTSDLSQAYVSINADYRS